MFRSKIFILHKLLNTSAHFGYRTAFSKFQPYLYGFRNDIAIINSEKTLICLRRACSVIDLIIRSNGHLIFVNTNTEYNNIVEHTARHTGHSFINHKWVGGLLSNWAQIQNVQRHFIKFAGNKHKMVKNLKKRSVHYNGIARKRQSAFDSIVAPASQPNPLATLTPVSHYGIDSANGSTRLFQNDQAKLRTSRLAFTSRHEHLKSRKEGVSVDGGKKTVVRSTPRIRVKMRSKVYALSTSDLVNSRIIDSFPRFKKMTKCFEGIIAEKLPDGVIILNANNNYNAICEAKLLQIPIIACIDSNVSNQLQKMITYPIPVNSDSLYFIYLLCNCIYKTILYSKKYSIQSKRSGLSR